MASNRQGTVIKMELPPQPTSIPSPVNREGRLIRYAHPKPVINVESEPARLRA